MDLSNAGRRQPRRAAQQQQAPAAPYEAPFANSGNSGYYDNNYYDPGQQNAPQMFDNPPAAPVHQPFMQAGDAYYAQPSGGFGGPQDFGGYGYPGAAPTAQGGGFSIPGINPMQQQFMFQAGAQFVQGSVDQYTAGITEKGKSWISNNLKYYFAVDTAYVLKKLLLIFFPFTHKDWTVKYTPNEPVAPRDDLNSPDLYIPSMAFVTYVLVAGYLIGLEGSFSPEKLGLQASSALAWLLFEVFAIMLVLYLSGINSCLGFFHLMSYSSYKFVCMIGALMASLILNQTAYYAVLGYSILALGFFLMRSLHVAIQTTSAVGHNGASRNGLHVVLMVCGFQAFVMYWLTKHLVGLTALGTPATVAPL